MENVYSKPPYRISNDNILNNLKKAFMMFLINGKKTWTMMANEYGLKINHDK